MTPVTGYLIFAAPSLANHVILAKANPFNLANDRARIASSGHSQPCKSGLHGGATASLIWIKARVRSNGRSRGKNLLYRFLPTWEVKSPAARLNGKHGAFLSDPNMRVETSADHPNEWPALLRDPDNFVTQLDQPIGRQRGESSHLLGEDTSIAAEFFADLAELALTAAF